MSITDDIEAVRRSVDQILDAAAVAPDAVNRILAGIPENQWCAMMSTLRMTTESRRCHHG
jgi:hypothetical protein